MWTMPKTRDPKHCPPVLQYISFRYIVINGTVFRGPRRSKCVQNGSTHCPPFFSETFHEGARATYYDERSFQIKPSRYGLGLPIRFLYSDKAGIDTLLPLQFNWTFAPIVTVWMTLDTVILITRPRIWWCNSSVLRSL